jgi:short-subunit dehydrogenase
MKVLIVGANSDIAKESARIFAKEGFDLILSNRDIKRLEDFKKDIELRYDKKVDLVELDLLELNKIENFYNSLDEIDGVIVASGIMYEQGEAFNDNHKTLQTINVNFTSVVMLLNLIAKKFEKRQSGFIIGISSVAGDRGRKANFIYGSSKAGFSAYLSGLRNYLFNKNVQVITVKPGFAETKMTENLDLPPKLTAKPEDVAEDIFNTYKNKKDIIYTKSIWRFIMLIIKHIPEFIFKRLSI